MGAASTAGDLGLYIHIPFCERVCPYCDFAVLGVGELSVAREREYVDLLLRELELRVEREGAELQGAALATVYFGGGTPGLLRADSVDRLLGAARAHWGPPREVTLELNPGRVEASRAVAFREAGVTRVSVGVQALTDATLSRLGRAQRAHETLRGLERCLAAGFESLSADFILGAPGQTRAELYTSLDRLVARGVPHLSVYALTIEPGTPFARARDRGQLAVADEDEEAELLCGVRSRLRGAGYEHYEVSSYAQPGHRSRHNQRYWRCQDVLGLGVSAASLVAGRRFQNTRDLSL